WRCPTWGSPLAFLADATVGHEGLGNVGEVGEPRHAGVRPDRREVDAPRESRERLDAIRRPPAARALDLESGLDRVVVPHPDRLVDRVARGESSLLPRAALDEALGVEGRSG